MELKGSKTEANLMEALPENHRQEISTHLRFAGKKRWLCTDKQDF